jgi:hypothetical protein
VAAAAEGFVFRSVLLAVCVVDSSSLFIEPKVVRRHSLTLLQQSRVARVLSWILLFFFPLNAKSCRCNAHGHCENGVDESDGRQLVRK